MDQDALASSPNGITFSPDFRKVYIVARGGVIAGDVTPAEGWRMSPRSGIQVDGIRCAPDGVRTDVFGNLWCSSNAGNNVGYSGVTVTRPRASCRPDPAPRGVRQPDLWRPEAEPVVHGRRPVALRGVRQYPGRGAGVVVRNVRVVPESAHETNCNGVVSGRERARAGRGGRAGR